MNIAENGNRLVLHTIAYWMMIELHYFAVTMSKRRVSFDTIRLHLVMIAVRLRT